MNEIERLAAANKELRKQIADLHRNLLITGIALLGFGILLLLEI